MGHIHIEGNLVADPQLHDAGGTPVAHLRVIEHDRWQDDQGQWQEGTPTGHQVVVWGAQAQRVAECLRQGDPVLVYGKTYTDTWTDEGGQQHYRQKVRATSIGPSLRYIGAILMREKLWNRQQLRTRANQGADRQATVEEEQ